ncbi:MAG TPA: 4Fe-4S binding protein [Caldilineae bacterium]|nr:4Fe-4S binding protein [Caldilineae bacterium]
MLPPIIADSVCQACRRCLARQVCKAKAIVRIDPDEAPFVDGARCRGCLVCMPACPFGAVQKPLDSDPGEL